MWMKLLLVLLVTFNYRRSFAIKYKVNDDTARGLRISFNNNFSIAAFNGFHRYILRFPSERFNIECAIYYRYQDFYVYSLAALTMKSESTNFSFIQIGENTTSHNVILSVVTSDISSCNTNTLPIMLDHTIWTKGHQESILLKTDRNEEYAYVFADSFVFSYDLSSNKIVQQVNNTFFPRNEEKFIPTAFDLTYEWAVVIGYSRSHRFGLDIGAIYLIRLRPAMLSICPSYPESEELDSIFRSLKSTDVGFNQNYGLSISIDPKENLVAIGDADIDNVMIYQMTDIKNCMRGNATFATLRPKPSMRMREIGFGRSVTWLDDQGTLAVLIYKSDRQIWSESEIYVYKDICAFCDLRDVQPDYILPNNQQTFAPLPKTSFLRILAHSNNLLVLRNDHKYVYIPFTEKGSAPMLIERYT